MTTGCSTSSQSEIHAVTEFKSTKSNNICIQKPSHNAAGVYLSCLYQELQEALGMKDY